MHWVASGGGFGSGRTKLADICTRSKVAFFCQEITPPDNLEFGLEWVYKGCMLRCLEYPTIWQLV